MSRSLYIGSSAANIVYVIALVCCAVLCSLPATSALADLTIVSRIDVSRTSPYDDSLGNPADVDRNVTIYSHGKQARTEVDGVLTSIIDGDSVYAFDDQAKTYYKESLTTWMDLDQPTIAHTVPHDVLGMLDVDSKLDLDKTNDSSDNIKTLANLPSKKYDLSGWFNLSPKEAADSNLPNKTGVGRSKVMTASAENDNRADMVKTVQFSGASPGGGEGATVGGRIISTTIGGEIWLAKSVTFTADKGNNAWSRAMVSSWGVGQVTSDLASKIANQKALPTLATVNFSWSEPNHQVDVGSDDSEATIQTSRPATATMTMNVSTISEAAVDPALFTIPTSYTKTSAPAAPPPPPPAPARDNNQNGGATGGLDKPDDPTHY